MREVKKKTPVYLQRGTLCDVPLCDIGIIKVYQRMSRTKSVEVCDMRGQYIQHGWDIF
jgi:hypothetical protein